MPLPVPPDARPFRFAVWRGQQKIGVAQFCVDSRFERCEKVRFRALEPAVEEVVFFASGAWLALEDGCRLQPLLAATHDRRHVRGRVRTASGWHSLTSCTASYAPAWA
eukprot:13700250-Alexandrium_andersonii.AAC.1